MAKRKIRETPYVKITKEGMNEYLKSNKYLFINSIIVKGIFLVLLCLFGQVYTS